MKWSLNVVLVCIFLVAADVEACVMLLLWLCNIIIIIDLQCCSFCSGLFQPSMVFCASI